MLYRSTDRLCRGGAAVKNLPHSASFHSMENNAPSKSGIKHLEKFALMDNDIMSQPQDFADLRTWRGEHEFYHTCLGRSGRF